MTTASAVLKALDEPADIDKKIEELERRKRDRDVEIFDKPVKFYVLKYVGPIPDRGTFSGRKIAYYAHEKDRDAAFDYYTTCMARFNKPSYFTMVKRKTTQKESMSKMTEREFRARIDVELQNRFVDDFMTMAFRSMPPATSPCFHLFLQTDNFMRDMAGLWDDETHLAESTIATELARYGLSYRIRISEMRACDIPCYDLRPYICKNREVVREARALVASIL
jgi:hypothetical protein